MNWYKLAQKDNDDPEFRGYDPQIKEMILHPPLRERIIRKFKEEYPGMTADLEDIWRLYQKGKLPKLDKTWKGLMERARKPQSF